MDTPSARMVAAAQAATETTDALGRRLALRRLTALDKLRLFKAAGAQLAQNPPWLGTALLAASVTAIDDIPVPPPTNEAQIEAAYHAGKPVASGTLYQYVAEVDGSTSTYQYDNAVFKLAHAGTWRGDASVKQRLEFYASTRKRM